MMLSMVTKVMMKMMSSTMVMMMMDDIYDGDEDDDDDDDEDGDNKGCDLIYFYQDFADILQFSTGVENRQTLASPPSPTTGYDFEPKPTALRRIYWASLVAQWLRIRLPMQGTRVRALVRADPTCCRATKPVRHNY
ncbi:hypothetical protein J1605_012689 [Eschrichtius robustus]|uniref:Uncharacterized protein n=1 Tax=Eschrichtius robustus TaxID=9764 RepID=A0AB34GJL7_ESCRO|nr:hypothetical protein J1605_012689 [Eschrichtius robustus]